eukprot:2953974-Rhodomonas_salina.2
MMGGGLLAPGGIVRDALYAGSVFFLYLFGVGFGGGLKDGLDGVAYDVCTQRAAERNAKSQKVAAMITVASFIGFRFLASRK